MTLTTFILIISLATPAPRQTARTTFITDKVAPNGAILVTPIHTPGMWLRPENAVAHAIRAEEALRCKISPRESSGTIAGEAATVHTIVLDCDGAKFTVMGIQFEETR